MLDKFKFDMYNKIINKSERRLYMSNFVWKKIPSGALDADNFVKFNVYVDASKEDLTYDEVVKETTRFSKLNDIVDFKQTAFFGESRVIGIEKGATNNFIVTIYDGENKLQ